MEEEEEEDDDDDDILVKSIPIRLVCGSKIIFGK
jgi:hypothetical protein